MKSRMVIMEHTPNCQKRAVFPPLHVFGRLPQALLRENNEGTQLELLLISSFFFIWSALMTRLMESQKTIPKWHLHKDVRGEKKEMAHESFWLLGCGLAWLLGKPTGGVWSHFNETVGQRRSFESSSVDICSFAIAYTSFPRCDTN